MFGLILILFCLFLVLLGFRFLKLFEDSVFVDEIFISRFVLEFVES